jgi:DnaJ family protein C protein 28
MRRDADGGVRIGPTWESVTERMIREAQEAGAFDDLPGRGRRLDIDDDPREGEMGLAFHILRTNDALPPWIAADREARRSAEAIERVIADAAAGGRAGAMSPSARRRFRTRLARAIAVHDSAVTALNATAPSVAMHRLRPDPSAIEARLEHAFEGRDTGDQG